MRLPDFLLIGAMKAGSSALGRGINAHPDIFMARGKEVHFFDRHYDRGLEWYASHFAEASHGQVLGEATLYMSNLEASDRMVTTLPEARLIAILRHPVDRAYSHYWHNRRRNRESRTFEEAIADPTPGPMFLYDQLGRYAERLRHIEERVGKPNLLVLLNEDLRHDRSSTLQTVWTFIGVNPARGSIELPEKPRTLVTRLRARKRARRSEYPPMAEVTRLGLLDSYRDEIDSLEAWLARDLSAWRR